MVLWRPWSVMVLKFVDCTGCVNVSIVVSCYWSQCVGADLAGVEGVVC
jgi:hypothetical protein